MIIGLLGALVGAAAFYGYQRFDEKSRADAVVKGCTAGQVPACKQLCEKSPSDAKACLTVAKALDAGAKKLAAAHGKTPDRLIEDLYLATLTRLPTDEEKSLLREVLGQTPEPQAVADLTWSLWMMPEYLLVR